MSAFPNIAIRHLFSIGSGATPESGNPDYWDGDIFWVTPEDVSAAKDGKIVGTKRRITDDGLRSCSARLSPPETIILTKRAPIGQLAIAEVELCSNQGCFLLEPGSGVDPQFYFHWLNANTVYLQILGRGSTFMELSTDDLKSLRVPYPPIHVQNSISQFLNENAAQIDTLIEAKQTLLGLLAEKRRTLVAEAVMRGLDRSAPLRPSGIDWLGDIPAHWEIRRSKWLFEERDVRSTTGEETLFSLRMERGLVPHNEVSEKKTLPEELVGYKIARQGELVVNRMRAATGLIAIAPEYGLVSPDYAVFVPSKEVECDYYVELFKTTLLQAVFRSESTGLGTGSQGFLRLYSQNFLALWFPYPPIEEQRQILEHLNGERAKIDKLATVTERSITLLKERRSALIAAAVTGQIEIPEAA